MHVLFVHQNYPAQFGHIAEHLAAKHGFRCTFVSQRVGGRMGHVERIPYQLRGGATVQTHYCSRSFENATWHSHAIFEALQAHPAIQPDLIVAHSGFCSSVFLRELYDCPILNYFEYFYATSQSDMDFRHDFPCGQNERLRARSRNATLLLDLENCDAGYSPTRWQRDRLPALYRDKVNVIFDGVDTSIWKPQSEVSRILRDLEIPKDRRVVTYASRGMESMRGFDIFMRMAKQISERRKDVLFLIAGEDRVCYGGDQKITGAKSFKDWVLSQDEYDPSRFIFLGLLPPHTLAQLFCLSDLHVYLTVPFVLSWSLINALACGATVLASDTAPVREVIQDGVNGLLTDFFDVDLMTEKALAVLDAPCDYQQLGRKAVETVLERYSMDVCLPKLRDLYYDVAGARDNESIERTRRCQTT